MGKLSHVNLQRRVCKRTCNKITTIRHESHDTGCRLSVPCNMSKIYDFYSTITCKTMIHILLINLEF